MLRDYQQAAHDAAISWTRQSIEPSLIEAATGAGKSHIIAAIAKTVHSLSCGKHVLCLQPNAELVAQNRNKFLLTGNPASVFSASAGQKCLRHPVVFGTPGTVKNRISRFGSQFALIIIDECHGITPTIKAIVDAIKTLNPNVRVLGLTATPYRLGSGYIYAIDENGTPSSETKNPYFKKKVYTVGARELIERGYLTEPLIGAINSESYDTLSMQVNRQGKFDQCDIDRAYHGHGRKTSAIIADVVRQSQDRKGVMIFAATIQHANECYASLPPGLSSIVTSKTPKAERQDIVKRFKSKKIKYIVNVAVFTTGFDAPHVDVIAILRATESAGLLQQIIGRGLRIDDGKENCIILDYAQNIERHAPDGDIFAPEIKATKKGEDCGAIKAICPDCDIENTFAARPNLDGFDIDPHGYFLDLEGNQIPTDFGAMPAHFGRRCQGLHPAPGGTLSQCHYRWTYKQCPHCESDNDIAARYCKACRGEIIDPNEKLHIEFKKLKRDPTRTQTDKVIHVDQRETVTSKGDTCLRVDFTTEYRSFPIWFHKRAQHMLAVYNEETNNGQKLPKTVTYKKDPESKFYRVIAFNQPADEDLSQ